jgi:hypothetical protein
MSHHQMEATMRKLFLIGIVLLSSTAAQAGLSDEAVASKSKAIQASLQQRPDSSAQVAQGAQSAQSAEAAKRQAMMQQKQQMMMQKQMMMQREMARHPIRTRIHFGILNIKRKLRYAFH